MRNALLATLFALAIVGCNEQPLPPLPTKDTAEVPAKAKHEAPVQAEAPAKAEIPPKAEAPAKAVPEVKTEKAVLEILPRTEEPGRVPEGGTRSELIDYVNANARTIARKMHMIDVHRKAAVVPHDGDRPYVDESTGRERLVFPSEAVRRSEIRRGEEVIGEFQRANRAAVRELILLEDLHNTREGATGYLTRATGKKTVEGVASVVLSVPPVDVLHVTADRTGTLLHYADSEGRRQLLFIKVDRDGLGMVAGEDDIVPPVWVEYLGTHTVTLDKDERHVVHKFIEVRR